jgi:hypothetical protein
VRLDGDICRTTDGAAPGNFLISPVVG